MASVTLRGRFPAGAKVALHRRTGDIYNPGTAGGEIKTATVDRKGEVTFSRLDQGARYWIAGELNGVDRGVAVTAKAPDSNKRLSQREIAENLAQTRPPQDSPGKIITGARGTKTARTSGGMPFASDKVGLPTPDGAGESVPHPRLEDASGPQRSDTITGESHPVDPDLPDGKLRQDQVPAGTPQRSATPLGEATPLSADELKEIGVKPPRARKASPRTRSAPKRKAPARSSSARGKKPKA